MESKRQHTFITLAQALWPRVLLVLVLAGLSLVWSVAPTGAQGQSVERRQGQSVRHDESPALRDIPPLPNPPSKEPREKPGGRDDDNWPPRGPRNPQGEADSVAQTGYERLGKIADAMPAPVVNFEGTQNSETSYPPDPMGDVGPNHYIQSLRHREQPGGLDTGGQLGEPGPVGL